MILSWYDLKFTVFVLESQIILFFVYLGPRLWHMEVPRLGVESELQPPAHTTATGTNRMWDPHHSSQQHQIPNPLSKARDWTHVLMNASQVCYH